MREVQRVSKEKWTETIECPNLVTVPANCSPWRACCGLLGPIDGFAHNALFRSFGCPFLVFGFGSSEDCQKQSKASICQGKRNSTQGEPKEEGHNRPHTSYTNNAATLLDPQGSTASKSRQFPENFIDLVPMPGNHLGGGGAGRGYAFALRRGYAAKLNLFLKLLNFRLLFATIAGQISAIPHISSPTGAPAYYSTQALHLFAEAAA